MTVQVDFTVENYAAIAQALRGNFSLARGPIADSEQFKLLGTMIPEKVAAFEAEINAAASMAEGDDLIIMYEAGMMYRACELYTEYNQTPNVISEVELRIPVGKRIYSVVLVGNPEGVQDSTNLKELFSRRIYTRPIDTQAPRVAIEEAFAGS